MSISSTSNKVVFLGNGLNKSFPVTFKVQQEADIHVYLTDPDVGIPSEITSNWSVYPTDDTYPSVGATVTYPSIGDALPAGHKLTVARHVLQTQEVNYGNNSTLKPKVIEESLDRLTMMVQELQDGLNRSVVMPIDGNTSTTLNDRIAQAVLDAEGYAIRAEQAANDSQEGWLVNVDYDWLMSNNADTLVASQKATKTALDTKVDKVTGKVLSTNDFSNQYLTLANNSVQSVTGWNLSENNFSDAEQFKLGNLSYHPATHPATMITQDTEHRFCNDAEKLAWGNKQASLGFTPENAALKGVGNGYASLGADGKVPAAQIPTYGIEIALSPATWNTNGYMTSIQANLVDVLWNDAVFPTDNCQFHNDSASIPFIFDGYEYWHGNNSFATQSTTANDYGTHPNYLHATKFIGAYPVGSGKNGPASADIGLVVSAIKQDFMEGSQSGEVDGLYVIVRQGESGNQSDCAAILTDVVLSGNNGWAGTMESIVQHYPDGYANWNMINSVRTQMGVISGVLGVSYGFVAQAESGNNTEALRLEETTGSWNDFIKCTAPAGDKFRVSRHGVAYTAGGIEFPPTAIGSTGVNVLDDYEEGTCALTLVSEGGTLGTNSTEAYYTKIGRLVQINGYWAITSKGTGTGSLAINDLPFAISSYCGGAGRCVKGYGVIYDYNGTNSMVVLKYDGTTCIEDAQNAAFTISYMTST